MEHAPEPALVQGEVRPTLLPRALEQQENLLCCARAASIERAAIRLAQPPPVARARLVEALGAPARAAVDAGSHISALDGTSLAKVARLATAQRAVHHRL